MKSERRHELKTNALAHAVVGIPNTGWRNAATGITIVLAGLAIGLLIRFRIQAGQDRVVRAADNLAVAREDIAQLQEMTAEMSVRDVDPSLPLEPFRDALSRLESVLTDVGDGNPTLAAEALVARGDVNWHMAQFSASTTQPSASTQTPSDLLDAAQSAYQQVVSAYPQQHFSVDSARFGLAAIAENRHDWATARQQFQAIVDDPSASDLFKTLATHMKDSVDQLEHPPVLAAATQPVATQPAAK